MNIIYVILSLIPAFLSFFLNEQFLYKFSWVIFAFQLLVFAKALFPFFVKHYMLFFCPSFLTLLYLGLNFTLGAWSVANYFGMYPSYFYAVNNIGVVVSFFLVMNFVTFCVTFYFFRSINNNLAVVFTSVNVNNFNKLIFITLIICILLLFLKKYFEIPFFNFLYFPSALCVVSIFSYYASRSGRCLRFFMYVFFLLGSIINNFQSKREIVFIFMAIIFFELRNMSSIKIFSRKSALFSSLFLILVFYMVVTASILRGYGGYGVSNFFEANQYVVDYISSEYFLNNIIENFEFSIAYPNSVLCVDYFFDSGTYLFGSTFLKIFLVVIPRDILPGKFESMINIYSNIFRQHIGYLGGSKPVVLYSELFANFGFFAMFFLYFILKYINKVYYYALDNYNEPRNKLLFFVSVFFVVLLLQFIRGSGIDLYFLYVIFTVPVFIIVVFLCNLFKVYAENSID